MTRRRRAARTRAMQAGRRTFKRWRAAARADGRDVSRFLTVHVEARWTPGLTLTVLRTQQEHRDLVVREGRSEPTEGAGIL